MILAATTAAAAAVATYNKIREQDMKYLPDLARPGPEARRILRCQGLARTSLWGSEVVQPLLWGCKLGLGPHFIVEGGHALNQHCVFVRYFLGFACSGRSLRYFGYLQAHARTLRSIPVNGVGRTAAEFYFEYIGLNAQPGTIHASSLGAADKFGNQQVGTGSAN